MTTLSTSPMRGGELQHYAAPSIETLEIRVEQGFAISPDPIDYGSEGDPGMDPDTNDGGSY